MPKTTQPLFVQYTRPTRTARQLERLARETTLETDIDRCTKWARATLRAARLPTDLKAKTKKSENTEESFIPLLRKVKPNTVESHAADVLFYAEQVKHHLKKGDGESAVWCALRLAEHRWVGFIEQNLTTNFRRGHKQSVNLDDARRIRQLRSDGKKTLEQFSHVMNHNPTRSHEWGYRQVASALGITSAAAKKRILRQRGK